MKKLEIDYDNLVTTGRWGFTDPYTLEELYQAFKERLMSELCVEVSEYVDAGDGYSTVKVEKYKLTEDFNDRD